MVEITDTPPLSIRRELDVIVLQEVRADLKALHRPSRPAGIAGQTPHSFFRSRKTRHRPSKALRNPGHCPAKELFWTAVAGTLKTSDTAPPFDSHF